MGMKSVEMDDGLHAYTLAEIAGLYDISERSLRTYIKSGRLKAVRFGRFIRVTRRALKEFLNGVEAA